MKMRQNGQRLYSMAMQAATVASCLLMRPKCWPLVEATVEASIKFANRRRLRESNKQPPISNPAQANSNK